MTFRSNKDWHIKSLDDIWRNRSSVKDKGLDSTLSCFTNSLIIWKIDITDLRGARNLQKINYKLLMACRPFKRCLHVFS